MLKISTLTAWAELQIATPREEYLVAVVEPYRETLATLWIGALRDYASIRGDSEIAQESSSAMEGLYLNIGKEVLLPVRVSSCNILGSTKTRISSITKILGSRF
jgi:HEAT repeat-containing protein 5